MDLKKLTPGDQIIGVSGILLFIFSFFNWLGFDFGAHTVFSVSASASAWHFTLTLLAVLLGIVLVIYVVLKAAGVEMPEKFGSVTMAQVLVAIAVVAFLFVLIKVIVGPNAGVTLPAGVTKSRKVGIFLGLLATIGLVVGAVLDLQGERAASS